MALSIQLPLQSINYIPTANTFNGDFNTVAPGKYSFNKAANTDAVVLPLQLNTLYFVERVFISGNIPAEEFLSALDTGAGTAQLPAIYLKRKQAKAAIMKTKMPVYQFTTNREAPVLFYSDKKDDVLLITMTGQLVQTAFLVGIDPVVVTISLSIYEINEKFFNMGMRTKIESDFGLSKRRTQ